MSHCEEWLSRWGQAWRGAFSGACRGPLRPAFLCAGSVPRRWMQVRPLPISRAPGDRWALVCCPGLRVAAGHRAIPCPPPLSPPATRPQLGLCCLPSVPGGLSSRSWTRLLGPCVSECSCHRAVFPEDLTLGLDHSPLRNPLEHGFSFSAWEWGPDGFEVQGLGLCPAVTTARHSTLPPRRPLRYPFPLFVLPSWKPPVPLHSPCVSPPWLPVHAGTCQDPGARLLPPLPGLCSDGPSFGGRGGLQGVRWAFLPLLFPSSFLRL